LKSLKRRMENETDYRSPFYEFVDEVWAEMDIKDKAICIKYRRQLMRGQSPSREMMIAMNNIHDKYPDFHVGCIKEGA
jgi:hypothetical protein